MIISTGQPEHRDLHPRQAVRQGRRVVRLGQPRRTERRAHLEQRPDDLQRQEALHAVLGDVPGHDAPNATSATTTPATSSRTAWPRPATATPARPRDGYTGDYAPLRHVLLQPVERDDLRVADRGDAAPTATTRSWPRSTASIPDDQCQHQGAAEPVEVPAARGCRRSSSSCRTAAARSRSSPSRTTCWSTGSSTARSTSASAARSSTSCETANVHIDAAWAKPHDKIILIDAHDEDVTR